MTSTISASIINRVAAGFNRFLNKNGAYPTTSMRISPRQLDCKTFRVRCSRLSSSTDLDRPFKATVLLVWVLVLPTPARMEAGFTRMTSPGFTGPTASASDMSTNDISTMTAHSLMPVDFTFSARQTDLPGQLTSTGNAFASFLLGAVYQVRSQHSRLYASFPSAAARHVRDGRLEGYAAAHVESWDSGGKSFHRSMRPRTACPRSACRRRIPKPNRPGALIFANRVNDTYWRQLLPRIRLRLASNGQDGYSRRIRNYQHSANRE